MFVERVRVVEERVQWGESGVSVEGGSDLSFNFSPTPLTHSLSVTRCLSSQLHKDPSPVVKKEQERRKREAFLESWLVSASHFPQERERENLFPTLTTIYSPYACECSSAFWQPC
jgi:hypothetical protein